LKRTSLRIPKLRAALAECQVESLLVSSPADIRYLCGFSGSNGLLLVLQKRTLLFTDSRYGEQARRESESSGVRVVVTRQLHREACTAAVQAGVETLSYDASQVTVSLLNRLQLSLPEGTRKAQRVRFFHALSVSPVAALRAVKDDDEVASMSAAALLGDKIFEAVLPHLRPGVPEVLVAAELEYAARKLGAEGMSFETIVASGRRSALPHGHASTQKLPRRGFVTLDFGVILKGYCSDMTRTVFLGKPTRKEREIYEAVLEAELAGLDAVVAGITAGDVDAACRGVLRGHGLARYFSHSTGHGVGLEIHEGPRIGNKVQEPLQTGMVVTVEPGVYIPGLFGIRIEDMVLVEAQGARVLTATPKQLLTL
jgi:Xaa-Pro aminopeptidase